MTKNSFKKLTLISLALGVAPSVAFSHEFSGHPNFYGHVNAFIGYQLGINEVSTRNDVDKDIEKTVHGLSVGVGYNVYYRLNKTLNLFAGATANVNIPLTSKIQSASNRTLGEKINAFVPFEIAGLLGVKANVYKDVEVESYLGFGRAISVQNRKYDTEFNSGKRYITNNAEMYIIGAKAIIKNKYTVGLEYRLAPGLLGEVENINFRTHALNFNFGIQLL